MHLITDLFYYSLVTILITNNIICFIIHVFLFDEKKKSDVMLGKQICFYTSYPSSDTTSDNMHSFSESDTDSFGTT